MMIYIRPKQHGGPPIRGPYELIQTTLYNDDTTRERRFSERWKTLRGVTAAAERAIKNTGGEHGTYNVVLYSFVIVDAHSRYVKLHHSIMIDHS